MKPIYWKAGVRNVSTNTDGLLPPEQRIQIIMDHTKFRVKKGEMPRYFGNHTPGSLQISDLDSDDCIKCLISS